MPSSRSSRSGCRSLRPAVVPTRGHRLLRRRSGSRTRLRRKMGSRPRCFVPQSRPGLGRCRQPSLCRVPRIEPTPAIPDARPTLAPYGFRPLCRESSRRVLQATIGWSCRDLLPGLTCRLDTTPWVLTVLECPREFRPGSPRETPWDGGISDQGKGPIPAHARRDRFGGPGHEEGEAMKGKRAITGWLTARRHGGCARGCSGAQRSSETTRIRRRRVSTFRTRSAIERGR